MQPTDTSAAERILADRARYVAPGMSTPRLVVARAEGARVTDPDGRTYIDFAGGIGCQNTGHRHAAIVEAIKEQADRYLHQCFMIGVYEPYVEVCRRLAELSPCAGRDQKSLLLNSGAEAVENAVKIARTATGRPAVVVFDNAFHGRTLLTMTMTAKVKPYKAGFGPFAPEVYRAPVPNLYRGITTDDAIAGLKQLFKADVDPATVACCVLEPVQGEGGFVPMPPDFPARLAELCAEHGILYVDDEVQSGVGRTGKMWAIEHYEGVEPDLLVSGKSIGGGLPLAAVTGRAELMDAVPAGGLGGTFGGNPLSCAAAIAVLEAVREPEFLAAATRLGETLRARLDALAAARREIGDVRGLGPMLAFELTERTPDRAKAIVGVRKRYGEVAAVDGVDLDVARGEFFTMLGPSGSGKTTTLRMIAGFERPDEGRIELGGVDVSGRPPLDRPVNTVFQDYALFPHMTVQQNVEYGLRVKKLPRAERRSKARDVLSLVRLEGFGERKPAQLSGGQRQRVALARAIVNTPRALLLDEPLGALDLKLRQELQIELKQIQQRLGMTFVYVTHDQEEALTMSDRIAVFNQGRIEQIGTPAVMYEHPATTFVAGFIGTSNILERGGRTFTVRPEKIRLLPFEAGEGEPGTVHATAYLGPSTKFVVTLDEGGELTVVQQNLETRSEDIDRMEGRRVRLHWRPDVEFAIEEERT